jgi:nucleoside diphosphate kinase
LALCLFEVESLQSSPVVAQALRTEATIKMVNSLVNRDSEDEAENFCIML